MYKIGDFSRITGMTVKALRYYDEEGILAPSSRTDNSYRYYDEHDFRRAQLITFLRGLKFSIAEIKDVLAGYTGEDDLSYYLAEKKALIMRQIKSERELIRSIDHFLQPKTEACGNDYEIEATELDAVDIASVRFKGAYENISAYFEALNKEIGGNAQGTPFCCFYDAGIAEVADIEVCVPVKGAARRLPGAKALRTVHVGSYGTLNLGYKALVDYAYDRGIQFSSPSREIYVKGPGALFAGNPNKYVTQIAIPIKSE
jgi:DNA-binding transcriptional MerR regulator